MEWKSLIVPLTQFAYSNFHSPAPYEEGALDEIAQLIAQGYTVQMSHLLETAHGSDQHYVWVYLTRRAEGTVIFGNEQVRRD